MNAIDRISATIAFGKSDRIPVIPQIFGHAATLDGVPLDEAIRDGELLAHCQILAQRRYCHDAVFALMDASVETEAAGSVLSYGKNRYPYVRSYALSGSSDVAKLKQPDPRRDGRMPELLRAAAILRREVGDDLLVVGCVLGPLSVALQLLGAERGLYLAIDHPEQFEEILDFATELAIRFGGAQIEAGVHLPLVFDPSASPAVVPPQFFREFEIPRLVRLFAALKKAGAPANWLHIAGPVKQILAYYPQAGVDIANFDYCVDPLEAQEKLPGVCLNGNLKPLSFVEATAEEITAESTTLLRLFDHRGGFILSSGCEIPPEARPENVAAMVSAVHRGEAPPCPL